MKLYIFHRRTNSKLFYKRTNYRFNPWLISVRFLLSIQSLPLKLISSCAYYSKFVYLPSAYGLWACAFISVKSINYTCTFYNYKISCTEGRVCYCYAYLVGVRGQVASLVSCLGSSFAQVVASCPTSDPFSESYTQPL